jgi:hypothetical protein
VNARLDAPLSRWLWLVKWLLLIPHLIVLAFLWIAFTVLTVIAFFAILFTGRYPRSMFDFNLGVLRWTWRVVYYGYAALGTDRYPPFSLGPEPDYPATLDIDYPERLSRGLVLVKWWLLAIPHYVIIGLFLGFSGYTTGPNGPVSYTVTGLITWVVLIAAVGLLFTGRYLPGLYDFALGMNRWVIRVGAYAGLMTDAYPPFRLDQGGTEPTAPGGAPAAAAARATPATGSGWTAGRTVAAVLGALLIFGGVGTAIGGGSLLWLDQTQRDSAGYLSTGAETFRASGHALRFEPVDIRFEQGTPAFAQTIGDVQVRAESLVPSKAIFVGIGPTADVNRYLAGAATDRVRDLGINRGRPAVIAQPGGVLEVPPTEQTFWAAKATGTGEQTLTWAVAPGQWSFVVMNADGSAPVVAAVSAGATAPVLRGVAVGLLVGGGVAIVLGGLLIFLAARRHPGPEERGGAPVDPGPVPAEPVEPQRTTTS